MVMEPDDYIMEKIAEARAADPDLDRRCNGYADPPFEEWPKIEKWRHVMCTVTEKIDGSNAHVYVPHDPTHPVLAGSRTRWIGPRFGCDNFGFGKWVEMNAELLRRLGPGRHYGEWWGAGIQRRYGYVDHRRLSLFNRARFKNGLPDGLPPEVDLVPELYRGPFDGRRIDEVIAKLYREGSVAKPGWRGEGKAGPEGVVIRLDGGLAFKLTDNGDAKKGRAHHVEAAAGAVSVDRDFYDGGQTGVRVRGLDMNGCVHVETINEDGDVSEDAIRAATYRVADRIVTADAAILDARKGGSS